MGWKTQFRASQVRFRSQILETNINRWTIWVNKYMGHPSNLTSLEAVAIIWSCDTICITCDTVHTCKHVATYSPFLDADDAGFAVLFVFHSYPGYAKCKKHPKSNPWVLMAEVEAEWIHFSRCPWYALDQLIAKHQLRPWPTKSEGKNRGLKRQVGKLFLVHSFQ